MKLNARITPQFSGGALSYVPWHFMHDRPLQLLVIPITMRSESSANSRATANPLRAPLSAT